MFSITLPFQPSAQPSGDDGGSHLTAAADGLLHPREQSAASASSAEPAIFRALRPQGVRVAVCVRSSSLGAAVARALGAEGFRVGLLQPPTEAAPTSPARVGSDGGAQAEVSTAAARPPPLHQQKGSAFVTPDAFSFASLALPESPPPAAKGDAEHRAAESGRAPTPTRPCATAAVVLRAPGTTAAVAIGGDEAASPRRAGAAGGGAPALQSPPRSPPAHWAGSPASPSVAIQRGWLAAAAQAAAPGGEGPCVLVVDCAVLLSLGSEARARPRRQSSLH